MAEITDPLAKAHLEARELKNGASRLFYALDKMMAERELAPTPEYTAPTFDLANKHDHIEWGGRKWRANVASAHFEGHDHALRIAGSRARFEVRPDDTPMESKEWKRRAELSGSIYGDATRLPNGVLLSGSFVTSHRAWPEGMDTTWGMVFGQIHMGSKVGGSPALAFRRHQTSDLRITTRGENDMEGSEVYRGPLSFDEDHLFAYEVLLHETDAVLRVWVDDQQVVDLSGVSIGHSAADSYWNVGIYASGGVTGPVVAEYDRHIYPGQDQ